MSRRSRVRIPDLDAGFLSSSIIHRKDGDVLTTRPKLVLRKNLLISERCFIMEIILLLLICFYLYYYIPSPRSCSAIALDATNPVFYCNRAAAHSRLSDYQAAADDCRMSLRYDVNYCKAYGRLGIAYSKLEKHELALEAYTTAIRLDPNNVDYQNNMAVTKQRIADAAAAATRPAGGPSGAGAGGFGMPGMHDFPDLSGMDLGAALANPDLMNMAQRMMTDPAMADIMQSLQAGGGMESLMDA